KAFYGCSSLQTVNIPNSVKSIGDGAFYRCSSLQTVNIPDSVERIGDGAFEGTPWKKNKQ
ncbi:MAG: leucine-rich repeat domain-containing protein, partial [Paludibacteraceae bacterium]|nr:leucine-rich repeat domain-containing protein [Paludibacteraceae bacterium]